jgi:hypothetical protein
MQNYLGMWKQYEGLKKGEKRERGVQSNGGPRY